METKLENKLETDDLHLINKIKQDACNDSLVTLINRYEHLCLDAYRKFYPIIKSSGMSFDEVYQERDYVVWKTANSFNEDKNSKYSTWLCNNIRFQCLTAVTKHSRLPVPIDLTKIKDLEYQDIVTEDQTNRYIDSEAEYARTIIGQFKDGRIVKIFNLKHSANSSDISWREVSEKMGLSIPSCISIYKKGIKMIKKKLESKKSFDKI